MVIFTACEGPAGPEGPAGADGQDGADGVDGEDGNANVTVYIFDGHDFTGNSIYQPRLSGVNETEMKESAWDVYMDKDGFFYHMPGWGYQDASFYETYHTYIGSSSEIAFNIELKDGPGEVYDEVRIVRTAANNVVDSTTTKVSGDFQEPPVDFSNYQEVVDYYNIDSDDIVDMRSK
ncbi:MAG: hypothetical protein U5J95_00620 [Balneolaceae bacterium]|nr:hypothetical protein [Balneolaceae bacterium]